MVDGVSDTMMSVMLNSHSCCHCKSQNNGNLEETKINKEPLFTFKLPFGIWLCKYYLFTLITTTAQPSPLPTLATYLHDAASLDTADPMERRARLPSPKYLQVARSLPTNWSEPVEAVALVQVWSRRSAPVRVKPNLPGCQEPLVPHRVS